MSVNLLEPQGPLQACDWIALTLPLEYEVETLLINLLSPSYLDAAYSSIDIWTNGDSYKTWSFRDDMIQ
jgi:hypothetical protein